MLVHQAALASIMSASVRLLFLLLGCCLLFLLLGVALLAVALLRFALLGAALLVGAFLALPLVRLVNALVPVTGMAVALARPPAHGSELPMESIPGETGGH